jgi:hypothetical protein
MHLVLPWLILLLKANRILKLLSDPTRLAYGKQLLEERVQHRPESLEFFASQGVRCLCESSQCVHSDVLQGSVKQSVLFRWVWSVGVSGRGVQVGVVSGCAWCSGGCGQWV